MIEWLLVASFGGFGFDRIASSREDVERYWLWQVAEQAGIECRVQLESVDRNVIGNNGYVSGRMVVDNACVGRQAYRVEYFPPEAFPRRGQPYQVTFLENLAPEPGYLDPSFP